MSATKTRHSSVAGTGDGIDRAGIAQAVRTVLLATSTIHGADCLAYAWAGAHLLQRLGLDATVCVGTASWRVGPGDGDMISHVPMSGVQMYALGVEGRAAVFHAWIEADGQIVDLTTHALRDKAAQLDAADGGCTDVQWCPDFVWFDPTDPHAMAKSHFEVNQAADGGAFRYEREPRLERLVLVNADEQREGLAPILDAVERVYASVKAGAAVNVVCMQEQGPKARLVAVGRPLAA